MVTFAVYNSREGNFMLVQDGEPIVKAQGYAGMGPGRDNPLLQDMKSVGPLPRGLYRLGEPVRHARLGPLAIPLVPHRKNEMFGRGDFMIHGDNKYNDASRGCIILPRAVRSKLTAGLVLAVI